MKDSYIVIQSWMVEELKLKGNELIVFAVIHGFSQDGEHWYRGTRAHLAEWCGATKGTVSNALRSLEEKGFIERREIEQYGAVKILYRATKFYDTPYQKLVDPLPKIVSIDKDKDKDIRKDKDKRKTAIRIEDAPDFSRECLESFNEITGQKRRVISRKLIDDLETLAEDYTLEDVRQMIEAKKQEWGDDEKMSRYLRPDTLFRYSNAIRYIEDAQNSERSWVDVIRFAAVGYD